MTNRFTTSLAVLRHERSRRGAALLVVVIAIVVAAMVVATLTQTALVQRRQMQRERDRAQAFWLLDSGVQRAVAQLAQDPKYRGENWRPDVPGPGDIQPAAVAISIERDAAAGPPRIDVTAEFPAGAVHRTRLQRTVVLERIVQTAAIELPSSAFSPENVVP